MNKKIKKSWSALDNNLVFDLLLGIDEMTEGSKLESTASAVVYCKGDPKTKLLEIYKDVHTDFDYRFTSGMYVRGYLSLQQHPPAEGTKNAGIYGDLYYGQKGRTEEHLEGFLALVPIL